MGSCLFKKLKRVLGMWEVLVLVDGSAVAMLVVSIFFVRNLWYIAAGLFFLAFCFHWSHVRYVKKKEPRYPLVPPKGKAGAYLPRTNIPRPVIADFREAEEEKKKLARLKKLQRKKGVRRKH